MINKIEVVPYDPRWPHIFESQSREIKRILGDNCLEIHHIGSTSVPGLDSKHKIDICLRVANAKQAILVLEKIGFEYNGDWNIPFKYGLRYRADCKINLH